MLQDKTSTLVYSVVIPIKNEEENILNLVEELQLVMQSLKMPWELLFIDDGSTDSSCSVIASLMPQKSFIRLITFTQNFGQSSAFDAGFKAARGEMIITMDGDGQNDPADIPRLLEAIEHGYDLACGWRINRNDPWSKKIISYLSNQIRKRMCRDEMHDTGCSLKIYRRSAVAKVKLYHGMHRFLPALFLIEGLKVIEVPVNHRTRKKGKSKYHFFNRSISPFVDMFAVRWMRKRKLSYQIKDES